MKKAQEVRKMKSLAAILVAAMALTGTALTCMADDEADAEAGDAGDASTAETYHIEAMGRFAKRAQDFDVGDYVQTGLVLHYDGIRNAGATAAHDPTATTWKNLVEGQPDAEFVGDTGAWDESGLGYAFNGTQQAYAKTQSGITLGASATIQIATDADPSANTALYTGLFRSLDTIRDALTFWSNYDSKTKLATITFKADNYGGNKRARSSFSGWDGKYVTAILGDGNTYIFQGTALENNQTRSNNIAVPEAPYSFGGSDDSKRWFKGVYHSVRVYTVALTEEQLKQNRLVDEIRFRGVFAADIEIASSVAVPEDTVAVGAYMVNGSHTFTRPESVTVGEATWNADGYTLEKWDAETQLWGAAETGEGDSFEYVNCEANGRMRLTWNWTLASGVKKLDADDYAQNGLVLNFDGVSNAGLGTHDAAATTWANLGSLGATRDATKATLSETYWHPKSAAGAWTRNAFDFRCRDYFLLKGAASIGAQATAQVAARHDIYGTVEKFYGKTGSVEIKWPMFFGAYDENNQFQAYLNIADAGNRGKVWSYTATDKRAYTDTWDGRMVNLAYDASGEKKETVSASTAAGWVEGENPNLVEGAAIGEHTFAIGTGYGGKESDAAARILNGRIHAVRVYDRLLTDAETARNRALDEARFYDSLDALEEDDAVLVRSESLGDGAWTDSDGAYIVRKTSKTFTAPAACTADDGAKYTCTGYRLETWNAAQNRWEDSATGTELSYTIDNTGETVAKKRLSWLWTLTEGILPSDFYSTQDYAQKDLLLHFDGIRNAGLTAAHSSSATAWANLGLSGDANDATRTALSSNIPDEATDGAWTDSGYTFGGKEYFALKGRTLALGSAVTVQTFSEDYDMANQVSAYPVFFGATSNNTDDFGLYFNLKDGTDEAKKTLYLKANNDTATAGKTTWVRPYATAMYDASNKQMRVGDEIVPAWQTANTDNPLTNAWTYAIGTSRNKDNVQAARIFVGTIGYTRVYTNVLDTAQLVRNRFVDEVRYRPNLTVVNGAVGETDAAGASSLADGAYYLVGEVEVAASAITVDGHSYLPRLLVEEEVEGEWQKVFRGWAESYKLTAGDNPLRLTWTWEAAPGLMIIVR